jgi:hypothetical protein
VASLSIFADITQCYYARLTTHDLDCELMISTGVPAAAPTPAPSFKGPGLLDPSLRNSLGGIHWTKTKSSVPQPTGPTKALSIVADFTTAGEGLEHFKWLFFSTPYMSSVSCRTNYLISETAPRLTYPERAWPGGSFDLFLFGETCTYKNDGHSVGKLFCAGDKQVECKNEANNSGAVDGVLNPLGVPANTQPLDWWNPGEMLQGIQVGIKNGGQYACPGDIQRVPMFACEW